MTQAKHASYYINVGRYNLCSNKKDACLQLSTTDGNFSALFDVDDQPDVDGLLPSEVMDIIEARIDSYWISTSRQETKERIAKWRIDQNSFDRAWLDKRIEQTEKTLKSLNRRRQEIVDAELDAATQGAA